MSLWDIVNAFDLPALTSVMSELDMCIMSLKFDDPYDVDNEMIKRLRALLTKAEDVCLTASFRGALPAIATAALDFKGEQRVLSTTVAAHAGHVSNAILDAASRQKYLRVAPDRCEFLDQEALFGPSVYASFPAARMDIREAGNCLAAECATGAVFHLMRSAEVVLRVLASDRRVEYPDGSIQSKEWGNLLSALDGKLQELRLANANLWPSRDVKEGQLHFYQAAIAEFRGFNDAWRKHVAHARAVYDRDRALSILNHTKRFMNILAARLSEEATTPIYWTTV